MPAERGGDCRKRGLALSSSIHSSLSLRGLSPATLDSQTSAGAVGDADDFLV
jgi:hypothetical protein